MAPWITKLVLFHVFQPSGPSLEPFLQDEVSGVCENQELLLGGDVPGLPQHSDHSHRVPPPTRVAHFLTRSEVRGQRSFFLYINFVAGSIFSSLS